MRRTVDWGLRAAALAAATVGVALLSMPAVSAHPFGPPPTALVSASGHEVAVEWVAASDDALVVGMSVGVLDDGSLERYLEGPVQTAPPAAQEEELSASPKLRDYLLDRIKVLQDGHRCEGTVEPIANFVTDGARLTYTCPEPVEVVQLRITMLHEVHGAYRTFAITEGLGAPAQSVFTADVPEQRWDFSARPASAGDPYDPYPPGFPLAASGVGVGVAGVLGILGWRRWARTRR